MICWVGNEVNDNTYVLGLSLDLCDGQGTLFLLDLVAVLPIHVLKKTESAERDNEDLLKRNPQQLRLALATPS